MSTNGQIPKNLITVGYLVMYDALQGPLGFVFFFLVEMVLLVRPPPLLPGCLPHPQGDHCCTYINFK
jgi:hypothetical protein